MCARCWLLAAGHELYVSPITVTEFYTGVAPGALGPIDDFVRGLPRVAITEEVSIMAADFRRRARLDGRRIHTPDAIIAASAHQLGATLLTANLRDFTHIGIAVEALR